MRDTHSHYALSFCEVSSNLLLEIMSSTILGTIWPDCDLDLGRSNLTLLYDTPSYYIQSFCEVSLNLLQ